MYLNKVHGEPPLKKKCVRELCANRTSHEEVGRGSDYDTDSDDSDVD